jgi:hypothetical protein
LAYQVVREALEREGLPSLPGLEAGFDPDAGSELDDAFGPDTAADAAAGDDWAAR